MAISARMRQAIRLYETGAAKTMREASEAAGFHPNTLTVSQTLNPAIAEERARFREKLDDKAINLASLVDALGRRALGKIVELMDESPDHKIQLRAAIDLADRAPQTAKTQRHQVTALTLDGKDARAIAEALVAAAEVRNNYSDVAATGDFIKVIVPENDRGV